MTLEPHTPESARRFLQQAEAFKLLVEGIPAITYVDACDDLSTALYVSPQATDILGFSPDTWIGDPGLWSRQIHPADRDWVVDRNLRTNATGEQFRAEYRMFASDGREVWIRDEAVLVNDDGGRPLFWRGVMLDITELKQAEAKLKRSLEMLRQAMSERRLLLERLEFAREEERRRIANDIHDDSIQVMASVSLRLQSILDSIPEDRRGDLVEVQAWVEEAIDRLRYLVFELHPPSLDRQGLVAALHEYLEKSGAEAGFEFGVDDLLEDEPTGELALAAYRITQEAITNVRKHAGAKRVNLLLEQKGTGYLVRLSDDGAGFSSSGPAQPGHLGLVAMRERAELADGWCKVESTPGEGTVVEVWLPFHGDRSSSVDPRSA